MPTLTVNPSAPTPQRALCLDIKRPNTPAPFPALAFGERFDVDLYVSNGSGGYDTRSGAAGYSPRIAVQLADREPVSGTFTLTDGTATTAALAYDASAQEVAAALNALNSAAGPYSDTVTVKKLGAGAWLVRFDGVGAQSDLSGDPDDIVPVSDAIVTTVVTGTASIRAQQLVQLRAEPIVYQASSSNITSGWRLSLNCATGNFLQAVAEGAISADYAIELVDNSSRVDLLAHGPVYCQPGSSNITSVGSVSTANDNGHIVPYPTLTALTGGASNALDSLATVDLTAGYTALLGVTVGASVPGKVWQLTAGTDAEDAAAGIVRPDDYAATTNEKVWKVVL